MRRMLRSSMSLSGLFFSGLVLAAPCSDAAFRDFDFWAGKWTVTTTDGQIAGANHITIEEQGCLLVEHWQGAQGSTGQS